MIQRTVLIHSSCCCNRREWEKGVGAKDNRVSVVVVKLLVVREFIVFPTNVQARDGVQISASPI
jgi:hypothetical protein